MFGAAQSTSWHLFHHMAPNLKNDDDRNEEDDDDTGDGYDNVDEGCVDNLRRLKNL